MASRIWHRPSPAIIVTSSGVGLEGLGVRVPEISGLGLEGLDEFVAFGF